ncbi:hypothetical protein P168DRAFT_60114 [Aspergillus campestris IBT 28561]|uniref:C2H2-type domain-containing protein n=1 Tax=Aspergillus campestris (strain IBT 28561) TaxID=1392248 RepID=A0A2I1CUB8_ASPC2|nr:uncharacterized protein P168DRAFT_60114 [Aspergillus campestris IBT 28561]PKY01215.1 hypothetical protein P168DRAFT_60114 [Aspergillus campestris IBT 28561]
MATYREAWSLFQDDVVLPSSSTANLSSGTELPGQSAASRTVSKTELVSELRRLRQDLQDLQSTSHPNQDPHTTFSSTQPDNSLPREPGTEKLEPYRCWESCCNGRVFSTRSNLIRHQRERKGESAKLRCSFCGAVFLRSSARNAHESARRCRR